MSCPGVHVWLSAPLLPATKKDALRVNQSSMDIYEYVPPW